MEGKPMLSRRSFFAAAAGALAGAAGVAVYLNCTGENIPDGAAGVECYIRSQELPPWPYPSFEPNDLTREQLAANLPVIGVDKLSKETPAQRKLRLECEKPVPKKETTTQFLRRLSLPCPGRLE